jgi:hypothetical protein
MLYYLIALAMAALSLVLIAQFLGFNPFGSSIVVAYSKGWISLQSAQLSLETLFGSSVLATAILSQVTVGSILGDAAAAALVDTTLLAWLGPWALVFLAAVIVTAI